MQTLQFHYKGQYGRNNKENCFSRAKHFFLVRSGRKVFFSDLYLYLFLLRQIMRNSAGSIGAIARIRFPGEHVADHGKNGTPLLLKPMTKPPCQGAEGRSSSGPGGGGRSTKIAFLADPLSQTRPIVRRPERLRRRRHDSGHTPGKLAGGLRPHGFFREPTGEGGPGGFSRTFPGKYSLFVSAYPAGQPLRFPPFPRHSEGTQGDSPPPTILSSIQRRISSRPNPISNSTSTVCSPRFGAGVTGFPVPSPRADRDPLLGSV